MITINIIYHYYFASQAADVTYVSLRSSVTRDGASNAYGALREKWVNVAQQALLTAGEVKQ
jgi:hypothetical protein